MADKSILYTYGRQKEVNGLPNKKMGRPTENPKKADRITVRLDEECNKILQEYCQNENIDKAEGIRRGIKGLKDK